MNDSKKDLNISKSKVNPNLKYVIFYILCIYIPFFVLHYILKIENIYSFAKDIFIIKELKFEVSDVVIGLLPTIITVVSIIFSLNDDEIYGISVNSFRKMRSNDYFSFADMIYFTIFVYLLYGISRMFDVKLCIYFVDVVVLVSSTFFIAQNIKLIEKNDAYIIKMLSDIFKNNSEQGILIENANRKNIDKLLEELLYSKGLREVFSYLKTDDLKLNSNILFTLLNKFKLSISISLKFIKIDEISKTHYIPKEIEDEINCIYKNINDIFEYKYKVEYNPQDFKNKQLFHHLITEMIIMLNDFYKSISGFGVKNLAYEKTKEILKSIIKSNNMDDDTKIKIINSLLFNSFINRKNKFIDELIDVLEDTNDCALKSTLIAYSSMLIFFENKNNINDGFNKSLKYKLLEENVNINSPLELISRKEIIKENFESMSFKDICSLFSKIMSLYKLEFKNSIDIKYCSLTIENFIELLLLKYDEDKFDESFLKNIVDSFKYKENIFFVTCLNENWFDDNNEFKNYLENHDSNKLIFSDFYDFNKTTYSFNKDSKIISYFKKVKNEILLKIYHDCLIEDNTISDVNSKFKDAFDKENFNNLDKSLDFVSEKNIISKNIVFESFLANEYRLDLLKTKIYRDLIEFLKSITKNKKYNFEICNINNAFRKLTQKEIEEIIATEFNSSINGIYNFNKFNNNKRVYVNKEEIIELIKGFYIHVELNVKYKVDNS